MIDIETILKDGYKNNYEWLNLNPNHYLSLNWKILHGCNKKFVETSCDTTVESILWKLSVKDVELVKDFKNKSICKVTIGTEPIDNDHVFIIINQNTIIQSYFDKYPICSKELTNRHIEAMENINNKINYKFITDVDYTGGIETLSLFKCYYWTPC